MNRRIGLAILVIAVVSIGTISFAVLGGFGQTSTEDQLDNSILEIMNELSVPGVAACIVEGTEVAWTGCYGYANIEGNISVTNDTLFMLGSISKVLTGIAFMQLFEQGLVDLDDCVNDYLPFEATHPLHPNVNITPRMLLSHVSGIRDNWGVLGPLQSVGDSPIPLSEFAQGYLTQEGTYYSTLNYGQSAPGTEYEYTNVGTTLIAYLVEIISETSFEEYCQEYVFSPLGMTESSWFLDNLNEDHIAEPYRNSESSPIEHYGSPVYPCGFLRTSVTQLGHVMSMLMQNGTYQGNTILSQISVQSMMTLHYPGISEVYGLCLQKSYPFWGHGGSGPGVTTMMLFSPESNRGVVVLTNGENGSAVSEIMNTIWDAAPAIIQELNP